MRVKLDENLSEACVPVLVASGHDVHTVRFERVAGSDDLSLFELVRRESRMLLTLDRGFGDLRRYTPGSHAGILVLRLPDQRTEFVVDAIKRLLAQHSLEDLRGCVAVLQRGILRINWPEPNA